MVERSESASLYGVVLDPSGALVIQAWVELVPAGAGAEQSTPVDYQGRFGFERLVAGTYVVQVSATGFARFESKPLKLGNGQSRELNVRLVIATQQQELNVSDEDFAEDSNPNRNGDAIVLKGRNVEELPTDSAELLQELKGLAGSDSPDIFVDGFSGGRVPPKQTIREIRINQNPYSARNDTNPGNGMIEILTKPGSNKPHGTFYVHGNDPRFNTQSPFVKVTPAYHSTYFEGDLGGPIHKKTSYFANGSFQDNQTNALVNAEILDAGYNQIKDIEELASPLTAVNFAPRVDVQAGPKSTMSFRYSLDTSHQTKGGVGLFALANQGYDNRTTTQTFQVSNSQIVNAKIVNDTRFQFVRTRVKQTPNRFEPTLLVQGAFTDGGNNLGLFHDHQNRYELQNYVSIQAGKHYLSPGVRLRVARDANYSRANYNGEFVFPTLDAYQKTMQTLKQCKLPQDNCMSAGASQYNVTLGTPNVVVTIADVAVFMQDDWKVLPHFTLSYGLRFETQNHINDHADWAPRAGFSWGLGSANKKLEKFTLRGGSGLFYQRLGLSNVLAAERQNGVTQQEYVVASPDSYPKAPSLAGPGARASLTVYQVSPAFHAAYALNSSIGLDRAIGKIGTVSVTYNYNRGVHVLLTRNINAPLPGTYDATDPASGVRPLGGTRNIYQYESTGVWRQSRLATNFFIHTGPRFNLYGSYTLRFDSTDANSGGFVSNQYDVGADFGRSSGDVRHSVVVGTNCPLPFGVHFYSYVRAASGSPFNIVLGQDLNGDSIFNDRPTFATELKRSSVVATRWGTFDTNPIAGQKTIPVNYGQGPALFTVNGGIGESFSFGPEVQAAEQAAGSRSKPASKPVRRYHLEIGADMQNVFNAVNLAAPVGTLNSPLFGKSTALASSSANSSANRLINLYSFIRF